MPWVRVGIVDIQWFIKTVHLSILLSVCPVNYFCKHRSLVYEVPLDQPELRDLDKFMVAEIGITVHVGSSVLDQTIP